MKRVRAVLIALALAACAPAPQQEETSIPAAEAVAAPADTPSWEGARAAGVDFRAIGQEPGWILDIYQQSRIVLEWNYGESRVGFPLTEPQYPQEGATRYETGADAHTLVVTIRRFPCQDSMSGENFPATVEIVIDGTTLNGCGKGV